MQADEANPHIKLVNVSFGLHALPIVFSSYAVTCSGLDQSQFRISLGLLRQSDATTNEKTNQKTATIFSSIFPSFSLFSALLRIVLVRSHKIDHEDGRSSSKIRNNEYIFTSADEQFVVSCRQCRFGQSTAPSRFSSKLSDFAESPSQGWVVDLFDVRVSSTVVDGAFDAAGPTWTTDVTDILGCSDGCHLR